MSTHNHQPGPAAPSAAGEPSFPDAEAYAAANRTAREYARAGSDTNRKFAASKPSLATTAALIEQRNAAVAALIALRDHDMARTAYINADPRHNKKEASARNETLVRLLTTYPAALAPCGEQPPTAATHTLYRELLDLAQGVARHFADTDAPLGAAARAALRLCGEEVQP